MNTLMIIFSVVVALVALPFIVAIFVKKDFVIARSTAINRPVAEVFNYVKFLNNQDYYNKWTMIDPNLRKSQRGIDGTVGFVAAWDSDIKQVGKGEQEIKKIADGKRIDLELRFEKPFKGTNTAYMTTEPFDENQTRVGWVFNGSNKYPMNFLNLFMQKMLGADMETSLTALKGNLEKM